MEKQLLQKYFRNQCSPREMERVLEWFRTPEGESYFEEILNRDLERYSEEENLLLYPDVPSTEMLERILEARKKPAVRIIGSFQYAVRRLHRASLAAVLLICSLLGVWAWSQTERIFPSDVQDPEPVYTLFTTLEDQHRIITLADGTRIRLNTNSRLRVPESFPEGGRTVELQGEAYFEVYRSEEHPFTIQADNAVVRVLGTRFNVQVDSLAGRVKVAVSEGKVSLSSGMSAGGGGAILTENSYAELDLESEEMLIERTPVDNYLSWFNGELFFYNEPLWMASRYLERLYNVSFRFEGEEVRELPLSTRMPRNELDEVLDIIAQTLGIHYQWENGSVLWLGNS